MGQQTLSGEGRKSSGILICVPHTIQNVLLVTVCAQVVTSPKNSHFNVEFTSLFQSTWPLNFLIWFCFHFETNQEGKIMRLFIHKNG